jgi:hypothetical protein
MVLWRRRFVGRWRRELQIRARGTEFSLADLFDRQQIFDAPERPAHAAEIHYRLGSFGAAAGNLLLNTCDVQVQRMSRRLFFLRSCHAGPESYKNRDFMALTADLPSLHRQRLILRSCVAKFARA